MNSFVFINSRIAITISKLFKSVYLYKLKGLDNKWYSITNRKVVYSTLPYGDYTFRLKVDDAGNQNNRKIIELPINIKEPFWKRTWFVILLLLKLSCVTYLIFKLRVIVRIDKVESKSKTELIIKGQKIPASLGY